MLIEISTEQPLTSKDAQHMGRHVGNVAKMNPFRAVSRGARHKEVHEEEQELEKYTEEDRQIDMMNIDVINSNAKSPGIIIKLRTSSYHNNYFTISHIQNSIP